MTSTLILGATQSSAPHSEAGPWILALLVALVIGLLIGRAVRKTPLAAKESAPKLPEEIQKRSHSREMPIRYVVAVLVILTLFLSAIVLPDVLRFFAPAPSGSSAAAGTTTGSQVATVPMAATSPTAATAQLFESYARLVTLFLGVASVLAIFFGYFVRKSIRETEEDVDKRFDRSLALWEKERSTLLDQYKRDAETLAEQLKVTKNLEEKMRSLMKELADTLESNRGSTAPPTPPVSETTAQVDEQLGNL